MSQGCLATFSFPPSFFHKKKINAKLIDRSINCLLEESSAGLKPQCHKLFIKIFIANLQGSFFHTIDSKAQ